MMDDEDKVDFTYMSGFGNDFETEALPGALPVGRNSPQKCNYGVYAEQLSGSAFTAPRGRNMRSWLYRIRPSVRHQGHYQAVDLPYWKSAPCHGAHELAPAQYRWDPVEIPSEPLTFVYGMRTMTTAGDVNVQNGMAAHVYVANRDMANDFFSTSDSELLIVPQEGCLRLATEMGNIDVRPSEVAVIPRGVVFRVSLPEGRSRGFVCENYGARFTLPERGPIGANCLANGRDFKTPVAAFEDREDRSTLTLKWCGRFYRTDLEASPLDVVAWHGNYAPYKYDLTAFSPVGAISFDHPDPSIFTVLTAPSDVPGTANVDFVIFPERWLVGENTFRPPWYHRNIMSEFMGNIAGVYDAKPQGFIPGGMSLHNCMLPHGPDAEAFEAASNADLKPAKLENTLSFMFETRLPQHLTSFAAIEAPLQSNYSACWSSLKKHFDGTPGTK